MTALNETEFERLYDASLEKVWQAWTDPTVLKKWWGPNGVTIAECSVDLRVNGRLYIVMLAGSELGEMKGARWPMEATYTAIEENTMLAYSSRAWTEGQEDSTQIHQQATMTLSSENGKTKMNLKVITGEVGPGAKMAIEGMKWGFNQQFDKLATFLGN